MAAGPGRAGPCRPLLGNRRPPRLAGPRRPPYSHPRSAARSHWLPPRGARLPLLRRRPCRVLIGAPPSGHAASLSHTIPPRLLRRPRRSRWAGPGEAAALVIGRRQLPLSARAGARAAGPFKGAARRLPPFPLAGRAAAGTGQRVPGSGSHSHSHRLAQVSGRGAGGRPCAATGRGAGTGSARPVTASPQDSPQERPCPRGPEGKARGAGGRPLLTGNR